MKEHKISYKLIGKDVMSLTIIVGKNMSALGKARKQIILMRSKPYYNEISILDKEIGRNSKKLLA